MSAPNRNTLWAETLVEEFVAGGVDAVCVAPGSRSTPLVVALADHPEVTVFSHLDERSAAFFALGRGRRTGRPTPVVCTSGTAGANLHPAVLEASESRVPLLVLTADRPPALHDSGANQTTDQHDLYGDAVRYGRTLPEPEADPRKLRSLRVTAARALAETTGRPPGPVHLNIPFRKPLEPTPVPGDVGDLPSEAPLAATGRDGRPFVATTRGESRVPARERERLAAALAGAERGLVVCGPADAPTPAREALAALAGATGFPVLADPLSGHRFGPQVAVTPVCGGYDSYLDGADGWPDPELVVRFGASPTSKTLRKYLAGTDARQVVVDPAGGWREAEFTASDLVAADPTPLARDLAGTLDGADSADAAYRERFAAAEREYWALVDDATTRFFEGAVLATVARRCPDPATVFVSNSMPVRDLDRFGRPRDADLRVLGNRGVSGIDGITSTALGAGSATDDPLVLVTGDLAFYHDMNGLLALTRCGVDATIVLVDNDGGGIFHMLPIESFDPPFTEQFRTPHGLDFEPAGDIYGFAFERFDRDRGLSAFGDAFEASVGAPGTQVLAVELDGERSHRTREEIHERVLEKVP
jgi:2-succinyl-5-enolpyruvyl-6-hydroxy-3-cyclohexene-1-carboxylate synthase